MNDNQIFESRTVAFLDILGFKSLVNGYPLKELAEKYVRLIDIAKNLNRPLSKNVSYYTLFPSHPKDSPYCKIFVLSDAIILISKNSDEIECLKLLVYAWSLLQLSITNNLPIRGGIAFGEIFIDQKRNILLGKALVEAYELEKCQNWIGVAIDKSVEKAFPNLFAIFNDPEDVFYPLFLKYDVPLKTGFKKLHTLNWRLNLIVERGTRSLFSEMNDKKIMEKINNTLNYANHVVSTEMAYNFSNDLPVELITIYHGSSKPPFEHGDDL